MSTIRVEVRVKPTVNPFIPTTSTSITINGKIFAFSKVHVESTQDEMFGSVLYVIKSFVEDGVDATILAYGQTGSGKTYTMGIGEEKGILQRALEYILCGDGVYRASFVEIYNEEVIDLLSDTRHSLPLRESKGACVISGLSFHNITSENKDELIRKGLQFRTIKSTSMNRKSSRGHAIFTLYSSGRETISFVDLAGSERMNRIFESGSDKDVKKKLTKECISINQGLLSLSSCVNALSRNSKFVPFRTSKLTRVLQKALSGNSKTHMIICVSQEREDINETINTLKYAMRASNIEIKQCEVKRCDGNVIEQQLRMEILRLKEENKTLRDKNGIEKLNSEVLALKERIKELEKSIIEKDNELTVLRIGTVKIGDTLNSKVNSDRICGDIEIDSVECLDKVEGVQKENESMSNVITGEVCDDKCLNSSSSVSKEHLDNTDKNDTEVLRKNKDEVPVQRVKRVRFNTEPVMKMITPMSSKRKLLFTPRKEAQSIKIETKIIKVDKKVDSISYNGKKLYAISKDLGITEVDVNSGSITPINISEIDGRCYSAVIKPYQCDSMLFGYNNSLFHLDTRSGKYTAMYTLKYGITALYCRGNVIIAGCRDGSLSIFDARNNILTKRTHRGCINAIACTGNKIYTAGRDHTIHYCNFPLTEEGGKSKICKDVFTLISHHYDSINVLLTHKGMLVSGGKDCSLNLFKDDNLVKTTPYAHTSSITSGVSNKLIWTGSSDGWIKAWENGWCIGKTLVEKINSMEGVGNSVWIAGDDKLVVTSEACKSM